MPEPMTNECSTAGCDIQGTEGSCSRCGPVGTGRLRELLADTGLLGNGHPVTESLPWTGETHETLPGWAIERGYVTGSSGRIIAADLPGHWPLAELIAEAVNALPGLLDENDRLRAEQERPNTLAHLVREIPATETEAENLTLHGRLGGLVSAVENVAARLDGNRIGKRKATLAASHLHQACRIAAGKERADR